MEGLLYHLHYSIVASNLVLLLRQWIPDDVWKDETKLKD